MDDINSENNGKSEEPAPMETNGQTASASTEQENAMQIYDQTGQVILGPGSKIESILLGLGLPRLSSRDQDDVAKAKKYAMETSIKHVLMKQTVAHQQQQQKVAMYAQALSLMARVYIGSISFEIREETIKTAFGAFGPIKSVNMSWDPVTGHHKGFAFLEYEVPEAAFLAQEHMNGLLMGGRNIKARPPECRSRAQPIIEMISEDAKKYNRVYVASIHTDLTEIDVKSVFEAFGAIRCIDLVKGPVPGKHRGYAFIEYETEQAATDAVNSMNKFDLGGQHLRVGRAITPPQAKEYIAPAANSTLPTAAAVAAAAVTAKIQAMDASVNPSIGMNMAPQIVVGNTPPNPKLGAQIFSVPPPGVAIPQLPTPPDPTIVMTPKLYLAPNAASSSSSLSSGSPSTVQGNNSPATYSGNQFQTSAGASPVAFSSSFNQHPTSSNIPPPALVIPQSTSRSQSITAQPQSTAAAVQPGQKVVPTSTTPAFPPVFNLTEKQKQMLEASNEGTQTLAAQEDLKIKGNDARNMLMHKLMRRTQSCVLVLKNMVGPDEVDDSLQDEVADECGKYGQVEQVVIYQERGAVKIFVKYSDAQEVNTAKNALDGRYFGGRQVKAEIYDQNLFDHNELSQ